nr:hypothetical protein [Psychromonas hadalis]
MRLDLSNLSYAKPDHYIKWNGCNDVELDKDAIETIYQKRWKVEVFHKNIKSNTASEKSPAKTIKTPSNPIFMSLLATVKLEYLNIKKGLTTFALKIKLYIKAQKTTIEALHLEQVLTAQHQ